MIGWVQKSLVQAVPMAAAGLAAIGIRKALSAGWRRAKEEEPPDRVAGRDGALRDAILWTVVTGVAVSLTELVVRRATAEGMRRFVSGNGGPGE